MLEDYLNVKTGQDLVNLGVIPKTSAEYLMLITYKRLNALRDKILSGINEEVLGSWIPAVESVKIKVPEVICKDEDVVKYIKLGMTVRVRATKKEGKVLSGDQNAVKIEGIGGQFVRDLDLLVPSGILETGYKLADNVVADNEQGHLVKFTKSYTINAGRGQVQIPEGLTGILIKYTQDSETVTVRIGDNAPEELKKKQYLLNLKDIKDGLKVSNLGPVPPLDKEVVVRQETLTSFFPTAGLSEDRAEKIITAMLMVKPHLFLYGPAGSGKSQTISDIISIEKLREVIFQVEGCKVQCNRASLYDENFAKNIPACPECLMEYDTDYKNTGRFKRPKAKDVKVTVANFGEGHGVSYMRGNTSTNRMHLVGFKVPDMTKSSEERRNDEYDPQGFSPGLLPRGNNGIAYLDEADKLRPNALDNLLEATEGGKVKPDELRYHYPCTGIVLGTANDNTAFSDPLNDRVFLLALRYPDDVDTSYEITKKAYHGNTTPLTDVAIGDVHKDKPFNLRDVPMPVIIERAVDAFYMKIRDEYTGTGKREIFGSNRCKIDALDAARARLVLDQLFSSQAPPIVDKNYAVKGIQYAVCSRVQERTRAEGQKAKVEFNTWTEEKFTDTLKREEDTWWCRVYKNIAIKNVRIPQIKENFIVELSNYKNGTIIAVETYKQVKKAYDEPTNRQAQDARIKFPFMDYLFKEQPRMNIIYLDTQLPSMINYFLESRKNTKCTIDGAEQTK